MYEYGKKSNAYGRERGQLKRPQETWIRHDKPELRTIDEALAARIEARMTERTSAYLSAREEGRGPDLTRGR